MKILAIAMVFALIAVLAAPLAAVADESDTTEITGTITSGYTFTAPSDISLTLVPGATATGNSTGSLTGNNAAGYTVTARDVKATNKGYMVSTGGPLGTKFKIGSSTGSVADADVGRTLLDVSASGSHSVPLYVSQQVSNTDKAGAYSITITFTVTAK